MARAAGQARAQGGALVVVEEEAEPLVDEVAQEAELLLGELDVVVSGLEHSARYRGVSLVRAMAAA